MVVKAFKTQGILGGLKAIGRVLLDAILMPVQQLLELLAKIPGMANLAGAGAQKIYELRQNLGVDGVEKPKLDSPEVKQGQITNRNINENKNSIDMNINDPSNIVGSVTSTNPLPIPVRVTITNGQR